MKRFRTILQFVPRYRKTIAIGFVCLFLSRCLDLLVPQVLRAALDEVRAADIRMPFIRTLALALVGVVLVKCILHFGMRWHLITTSRDLERDLRTLLYGHLMRLTPSFFNRPIRFSAPFLFRSCKADWSVPPQPSSQKALLAFRSAVRWR